MRVRIIYGRLRPGTWDEYEQAYKADRYPHFSLVG